MKRVIVFLLILLLLGCGGNNGVPIKFRQLKNYSLSPTSTSLYGNVELNIHSTDFPAGITSVRVSIAGHDLYYAAYFGGTISGYTEGAEKGGAYPIYIYTNKGNFVIKNAFRYTSLKYPIFKKMVSVGASYTHGFISMGLDWKLQQYSPFAQVAKQAGAYFPQALIREGILIPQDPASLLTNCNGTEMNDILLRRILKTLSLIRNKEKKKIFILASYRVDPYLTVYNAGIGGATVQDSVEGAEHGRLHVLAVLEHLSYDPFTDIFYAFQDPPQGSPVEYALSLNPTVLFSTDLYADDILEFSLINGTPSLDEVTPIAIVKKELDKMFSEMNAKGVVGFIANMPDITAMPILGKMKNHLLHVGYSSEEVDAWWNGLKRISAEYSTAFTEVAEKYDNIHIVDFRGYIQKIEQSKTNGKEYHLDNGILIKNGGVVIGDEIFTPDYLGGLVSLDAVHLTYTGYALIADMFIEAVNKTYNYNIPYIDLEKIAEIDPLTPDKLQEMGIDLEHCRKEFMEESP